MEISIINTEMAMSRISMIYEEWYWAGATE